MSQLKPTHSSHPETLLLPIQSLSLILGFWFSRGTNHSHPLGVESYFIVRNSFPKKGRKIKNNNKIQKSRKEETKHTSLIDVLCVPSFACSFLLCLFILPELQAGGNHIYFLYQDQVQCLEQIKWSDNICDWQWFLCHWCYLRQWEQN